MLKRAVVSTIAAAVLVITWPASRAESRVYVPGVKLVLEVRSPDGNLRSYHRPGERPTYWGQDLPVVKGDLLTVDPFVATGGSELEEVRIRLDGDLVSTQVEAPWRYEVNTQDLDVGRHVIDVRVNTQSPGAAHNTASTSFRLLPQSDRFAGSAPEALDCAIGSLEPSLDREIAETSSVTLSGPALFFVAAGPRATKFAYALERGGERYDARTLPLSTHILIEPWIAGQRPASVDQGGTDQPAADLSVPEEPVEDFVVSLEPPGDVVLTVWVFDKVSLRGPPTSITLHLRAPAAGGEE
jgi:hypothetical protein